MFPIRILSLYNGWQILTKQKPKEWEEIEDALLSLTPDIVSKPSKVLGKENGRDEYNAYALMELYDIKLKKRGWKEATIGLNKGVKSNLQISNFKNKVVARMLSVEIMPMKDFNSYLLADSPRLTRGGLCDVFVMLIAANNVSSLLDVDDNSVLKTLLTEDMCRTQIKEL